MKFKSLSLIVGFSILSLVACNKGGSGGNSPAPAEQTATTTPANTENPATPAPEVAQTDREDQEKENLAKASKEVREKYAKLDQQLIKLTMKDDEKDLIEVLSFSKLLAENYEYLDEVDERAIFIARLKADSTAIFEVDGGEIQTFHAPRKETRIITLVGNEVRLKSAYLRAEAYGSVSTEEIPMIYVSSSHNVDSIDIIQVNTAKNDPVEKLDPAYEDQELKQRLEQHLQEALAADNSDDLDQKKYVENNCASTTETCSAEAVEKQSADQAVHGLDYYYWYEMSSLDVDRQLDVSCHKYGFEIIEEIMERQLNNSFVNAQMKKSGLIAMKCMARTYPKETAKTIARVLNGRKSIDSYLREINSPVLAVAAGQLALLKDGKSDLTEDLLDDLEIDQHNLRRDVSIAMSIANDDQIILSLLRHLTKYKAESDQKYIYRPAAEALIRLNANKNNLEKAMLALMKKDRGARKYREKMQTLRRSIKSIAFVSGEKVCDEIRLNDNQNKALGGALQEYILRYINRGKSKVVDETTMNKLYDEILTVDNTDYHILERVVGKDKASANHLSCVVID